MARLQCTVCRSLRLPASRRAPSLTRSVKGPWVHSGSGNEPAARPSSRPCSANWPRVSHAPPLDAPFGLAFHQSHPEMAAERAGDRRKVRRDGAGETRAGWRMGEPSRCCQRMAFIEALTRRHRELNNVAFGPKHPPSPDCRFFSERSGTQFLYMMSFCSSDPRSRWPTVPNSLMKRSTSILYSSAIASSSC